MVQLKTRYCMDKFIGLKGHATDIWTVTCNEIDNSDSHKFLITTSDMDLQSNFNILCDTLLFEISHNCVLENEKHVNEFINLMVPIQIKEKVIQDNGSDCTLMLIENAEIVMIDQKTFIQVKCVFEMNPLKNYIIVFPNNSPIDAIDDALLMNEIHIPLDLIKMIASYIFIPKSNGLIYAKVHFVRNDNENPEEIIDHIPTYVDSNEMKSWINPNLHDGNVVELKCNPPNHIDLPTISTYSYPDDKFPYCIENFIVIYIQQTDIDKISKIFFIYNGCRYGTFDNVWLKTRNGMKDQPNLIALPFPPIYQKVIGHLFIQIAKKEEYHDAEIILYYKKQNLNDGKEYVARFVDHDNLFIQCSKIQGIPYEEGKTITTINTNLALPTAVFYFVLLCNNEPVRKSSFYGHPFKRLTIYVEGNNVIYQGNGEYYSQIIPQMFGKCTNNNIYITYEAIFHNLPLIQPYDIHCPFTCPKKYLSGTAPSHSLIYATGMNSFCFEVEWDETFMKQMPTKSVVLQGYQEKINIGQYKFGMFGLKFF